MDWVSGLSVGTLIYVAFAFQVSGYMARDELFWRGLMLCGSAFYITYYFVVASDPLWDAVVTNAILASVNLSMLVVVVKERSTIGMSTEMLELYGMFPLFTPGQFRRLLRVSERKVAEAETVLVTEGEVPAHLFFVIDGEIEIVKKGNITRVSPGIFIAEIAYLTGRPASATVRVEPGARYLEWEAARLRRTLRKAPSLYAALVANLNHDLAQKVAHSMPHGVLRGGG